MKSYILELISIRDKENISEELVLNALKEDFLFALKIIDKYDFSNFSNEFNIKLKEIINENSSYKALAHIAYSFWYKNPVNESDILNAIKENFALCLYFVQKIKDKEWENFSEEFKKEIIEIVSNHDQANEYNKIYVTLKCGKIIKKEEVLKFINFEGVDTSYLLNKIDLSLYDNEVKKAVINEVIKDASLLDQFSDFISEDDVLEWLKKDFNSAMKYLMHSDKYDFDQFSDGFNKEFLNILIDKKWKSDKYCTLLSKSSVAYYASVVNGGKKDVITTFSKVYAPIERELYAIDCQNEFNLYIKESLYKNMSKKDKQEVVIELIKNNEDLVIEKITSALDCENQEDQIALYELLKKYEFKAGLDYIELRRNPVIMLYELENNDNLEQVLDTISILSFNIDYSLLTNNAPLCDSLYKKLGRFLTKNKVFDKGLLKGDEEFNIAMVRFQTDKDGEYFNDLIDKMFIDNSYMYDASVENVERMLELADRRKIQKEARAYIFGYGIFQSANKFSNDKEYHKIVDMIKKFDIPVCFLPWESLDQKIRDKLFKDEVVNKEEYDYLNKILSKDAVSEEQINELIRSLGYNDKNNTLKDVIVGMKGKYKSELSIKELYALQMYFKKMLQDYNVENYTINIFKYIERAHNGSCSEENKCILVNNAKDRKVEDLVKTLFHEVNHAIQYRNIKEMNIEEDEDIIDYEKDHIIRKFSSAKYYYDNYYSLSYEFDADYKAEIQTAILFDKKEKLFKASKKNFNKMMGELDLSITEYKLDYKREKDKTLDEYFDKLFTKTKDKEVFAKKVRERYPIIAYEYNLDANIWRKYTIKELIDKFNSASEKDRKIYKVIIKRSIDPSRVGEEIALSNLQELKKFKGKLESIDLEEIKDRLKKYNREFDKAIKYIGFGIVENRIK